MTTEDLYIGKWQEPGQDRSSDAIERSLRKEGVWPPDGYTPTMSDMMRLGEYMGRDHLMAHAEGNSTYVPTEREEDSIETIAYQQLENAKRRDASAGDKWVATNTWFIAEGFGPDLPEPQMKVMEAHGIMEHAKRLMEEFKGDNDPDALKAVEDLQEIVSSQAGVIRGEFAKHDVNEPGSIVDFFHLPGTWRSDDSAGDDILNSKFKETPVKDAKVMSQKPANAGFSDAREAAGALPPGVSLKQSGYGGRYRK